MAISLYEFEGPRVLKVIGKEKRQVLHRHESSCQALAERLETWVRFDNLGFLTSTLLAATILKDNVESDDALKFLPGI